MRSGETKCQTTRSGNAYLYAARVQFGGGGLLKNNRGTEGQRDRGTGLQGFRELGREGKSHTAKPEGIPEKINQRQRVDMYCVYVRTVSTHLPGRPGTPGLTAWKGRVPEATHPPPCLLSLRRASYFPFQAWTCPGEKRQTSGHGCRAE